VSLTRAFSFNTPESTTKIIALVPDFYQKGQFRIILSPAAIEGPVAGRLYFSMIRRGVGSVPGKRGYRRVEFGTGNDPTNSFSRSCRTILMKPRKQSSLAPF